MVLEGDQVVIGDTLPGPDADGSAAGQEIAYEVLCRRHHRRRLTRAVARASFSDPLPLGERGSADEP
jgi:thymidine kinase